MGSKSLAWVAPLNELGVRELPYAECVDVNQIAGSGPRSADRFCWGLELPLAEGGTLVVTHPES